jgi:Holliday junction resolvase RusA-like endonuclease
LRYDRGRLHLSSDYVQWKRQADQAAQEQDMCTAPVFRRHTLDLKLSTRFKEHRGDADNRLKAVLDWCERLGLIVDDHDCYRCSVEWADIEDDCIVTLRGAIDQSEYAAAIAARRREKGTV